MLPGKAVVTAKLLAGKAVVKREAVCVATVDIRCNPHISSLNIQVASGNWEGTRTLDEALPMDRIWAGKKSQVANGFRMLYIEQGRETRVLGCTNYKYGAFNKNW